MPLLGTLSISENQDLYKPKSGADQGFLDRGFKFDLLILPDYLSFPNFSKNSP